jgi:hypothetical protein
MKPRDERLLERHHVALPDVVSSFHQRPVPTEEDKRRLDEARKTGR